MVAQLVEFEVGHDLRAPPQLRVDENGDHSGDQEGPPRPVPGDSAFPHHAGDEVVSSGGLGLLFRQAQAGWHDQAPLRIEPVGFRFGTNASDDEPFAVELPAAV